MKKNATPPYSYRNDPAVPPFPDDKPIFLFDGQCGFCSAAVTFLLRRSKSADYRYVPAQARLGQALLIHYGYDATDYETALFLRDGVAYTRSEANLRAFAGCGFPYSVLNLALLIPQSIRDRVYDLVARNRMRIAGRLDTCMIPTPSQAARFLN